MPARMTERRFKKLEIRVTEPTYQEWKRVFHTEQAAGHVRVEEDFVKALLVAQAFRGNATVAVALRS